jgi:hypothetical protein
MGGAAARRTVARSFMTDLLRHLFEHGLPNLPLGG